MAAHFYLRPKPPDTSLSQRRLSHHLRTGTAKIQVRTTYSTFMESRITTELLTCVRGVQEKTCHRTGPRGDSHVHKANTSTEHTERKAEALGRTSSSKGNGEFLRSSLQQKRDFQVLTHTRRVSGSSGKWLFLVPQGIFLFWDSFSCLVLICSG